MLLENTNARILITGGTGLLGSALARLLADKGLTNVFALGSREYDLRDAGAAQRMFAEITPDYVFHLAARVYGIGGNAKYKSDALFENVMINTHVIEFARRSGVKKIVAMGSGCVYPPLPGHVELFENQIWLGAPHTSEDSYAHSKRLMLAQLQAAGEQYGMRSAFAISGNLYGPHDNFNIEDGHVTPSLIAKFFEARRSGQPVNVWGSGVAIRDFMHSDDAAKALLCIMDYIEGPVNMGSGFTHPIKDIVEVLQKLTGVEVVWDSSKPDGQLVRYYNLDRLAAAGFRPEIPLAQGVSMTYEWYEQNWQQARK